MKMNVIGNEITGGGSSSSGPLKSLLEVCPICGKGILPAIKLYHVYYGTGRTPGGSITAAITAFKQRPNPKNKFIKH